MSILAILVLFGIISVLTRPIRGTVCGFGDLLEGRKYFIRR